MDLTGLDVHLAGPWLDLPEDSPLRDWTAHHARQLRRQRATPPAIYRQARTGINLYRPESEDTHAGEGWAIGPREIELAACGTWFTRDPRGEGDEMFPMLPRVHHPRRGVRPDPVGPQPTPQQREKAAAAAREAVAGRTFNANAKRLLKLLDN